MRALCVIILTIRSNAPYAQEVCMRILVVEDDEKLSKILAVALSGLGDVDIALSGEKALQDVEKTYYDLIILDLMPGKLSGIEVLREIRRVHLMPIIILSALSDIDKKIDCFREGADDYITKPFAREELIVRCEAALRRVGGSGANFPREQFDRRRDVRQSRV